MENKPEEKESLFEIKPELTPGFSKAECEAIEEVISELGEFYHELRGKMIVQYEETAKNGEEWDPQAKTMEAMTRVFAKAELLTHIMPDMDRKVLTSYLLTVMTVSQVENLIANEQHEREINALQGEMASLVDSKLGRRDMAEKLVEKVMEQQGYLKPKTDDGRG